MRRRTVRDNCDSLVFFIELKPISTKDPKEFAMGGPLLTVPNSTIVFQSGLVIGPGLLK